MKLPLAAALVSLLPVLPALAGTPIEKDVKVVQSEARPRWSIGGGAVFRQVWADFRTRTPRAGLFRGGDAVVYDDGIVGPDGFEKYGAPLYNDDGTALGTINDRSQLSPTTRADPPGQTLSELRYHSFAADDLDEQEDVGTGAYLQLRYAVVQSDRMDVNLLFGYSWLSTELASGGRLHGSTQRYVYDNSAAFSGVLLPTTEFPSEDDFSATVYDAPKYNAFYGSQALPPRTAGGGSGVFAKANTKLDVDLHEIVFAPEVQFNLTDRLHAALAVGPTLNVIDTELRSRVDTYQRGNGRPARTFHVRDDSTEVKVGVAVQVNLTYDITPRFFFELASSYRYVPSFDVGNDISEAEVDASSWETKVGFGFRL